MTYQNAPNPTCETPNATGSDLDALLSCLTLDQIRFLVVRCNSGTDKDAALQIGISPNTVKSWPKEQKEIIDQALRLMAHDGLVTAQHIRRRNVAKAMAVKVAGLDSDDERVRQGVATEIIEWEMGKATQKQEVGLSGSVSLTIVEEIVDGGAIGGDGTTPPGTGGVQE